MAPSSKGGSRGKKTPEITDSVLNARRRLHDALALGIKYNDNKVKRWECSDAETQLHALKAIKSYINCISSSILQSPIVKDSISEMLAALAVLLQSKIERIFSTAADLTQNLLSTLGNSIQQYSTLEVIISLSNLLSLSRLPVAVSCAVSLNHILTKVGSFRGKDHSGIWDALEKAGSVEGIIAMLHDIVTGAQSTEYFIAMASLLETILCRWPHSRYQVWNNTRFFVILGDICASTETSISVAVLKLYSALALCGNGAMKLLENKDLLAFFVESMGKMQPHNIKIKALRLCQLLTGSENLCSKLIGLYCEPIVQGIIDEMSNWRSSSLKKVLPDQMTLMLEACRAALLTRWAGNHHLCLWKHGITKVLLNILLDGSSVIIQENFLLSSDELVGIIYNNLAEVKPLIWDVLGNLSAHCEDDFLPKTKGDLCYLDCLILCTCSMAVNSVRNIRSSLCSRNPELEPVARAVLLMVFSRCKYIASQARYYLSENVRPSDEISLNYLLDTLRFNNSRSVVFADIFHTSNCLVSLALFSTIPKHQEVIVRSGGKDLLLFIVKNCLNGDLCVRRSDYCSHLHSTSYGLKCCWENGNDLEREEVLLLYSLQALSQLIGGSKFVCNHHKLVSGTIVACKKCENPNDIELMECLEHILNYSFCSSVKWFAAYILNSYGFYGFPSKLGRKMESALHGNDEQADLKFLLPEGRSLRVHAGVLVSRCPNLLPQKEHICKEKTEDSCKVQEIEQNRRKARHEIQISNSVDSGALLKILEYVYTGFVQVDEDLVKPVKVLAKHCGLKLIIDMLNQKMPKWAIAPPNYNLLAALEPPGYQCSDIVLEANASEEVTSCSCPLSTPHIHAHKFILSSSCDYLKALFQSGMLDSCAEGLKIPVGWKALVKLVRWFYSGYLPGINLDCLWNNLEPDQQLQELKSYIELSSLGKFWLLREVEEESTKVVLSCFKAERKSFLPLIPFAARLDNWEVVTAGVVSLAPLYPRLRDDGELEDLSDDLAEMLRAEYARYCQQVDKGDDEQDSK